MTDPKRPSCVCPETNWMDGKGHDVGCPLYRERKRPDAPVTERELMIAEDWLRGMEDPTLMASGATRMILAQLLANHDAQVEARARLAEFDLIKKERPIDPMYWDMHHRKALESAARERSER